MTKHFPTVMNKEIVLYVPLSDDDKRRAKVTISVLEDSEIDVLQGTTIREPLVGELDDITAALVCRHYNLIDNP
jgi:hypothetical protein